MRRLDTGGGAVYFSATVYGKSGSGKSSLGVTAPKPLILLSESQAEVPIRQAAARRGVPVPPILFMESLDDCRAVLRALRSPKDQPFRVFENQAVTAGAPRRLLYELPEWPETVVIDTVTDICRLIVEEIREQSPPRPGKDGLPVDSERYWNVLGDRCSNLILGFRDAPVHKLFLCAEDDRWDGEGDERRRNLGPSLPMRKLPAVLSGAGVFTAYAYRRESRDPKTKQVAITHGVMSAGPEFMLLKSCPPIRQIEAPDFGLWVRQVRGSVEALPQSPAPSGESLQSVEPAAAPESEVAPNIGSGAPHTAEAAPNASEVAPNTAPQQAAQEVASAPAELPEPAVPAAAPARRKRAGGAK